MTSKAKSNEKAEARAELLERGAALEKKEDRHGDTHSGWWMNDVWLGPTNDPVFALLKLKG
jgi:hypothetical protein